MKRKLKIFLSCLTCCAILTFGMIPVEAAFCKHTNCDIMICAATGKVSYNTSTHTIEYGTQHKCTDCGYVYYTDTFTETGAHTWRLVNVYDSDNNFLYSRECCTKCNCTKNW